MWTRKAAIMLAGGITLLVRGKRAGVFLDPETEGNDHEALTEEAETP